MLLRCVACEFQKLKILLSGDSTHSMITPIVQVYKTIAIRETKTYSKIRPRINYLKMR